MTVINECKNNDGVLFRNFAYAMAHNSLISKIGNAEMTMPKWN